MDKSADQHNKDVSQVKAEEAKRVNKANFLIIHDVDIVHDDDDGDVVDDDEDDDFGFCAHLTPEDEKRPVSSDEVEGHIPEK